jgi:hypothetical protein
MNSIRSQLLIPIILISALTAVGVALLSSWQGTQRAFAESKERFEGIQSVTESTSFPLTPPVLENISQLTSTDLITLTRDGQVISSTIELGDLSTRDWLQKLDAGPSYSQVPLQINGEDYYAYRWQRSNAASHLDNTQSVIVLLKESHWAEARHQATMGPLLTGLSTLFILTTVAIAISSRMGRRITNLQKQVGLIASGNFEQRVALSGRDEIGQLSQSVNSMAQQLQQLWDAMNRQQKARTLHQLSGGLAHQLRNTLTGARLAIELHARQCDRSGSDDSVELNVHQKPSLPNEIAKLDDLDVAIRQLENAEATIQRLVDVGLGLKQSPQQSSIENCIRKVQQNVAPVARHLQKELAWQLAPAVLQHSVSDGPAFEEAITNLLLNAIDAGSVVEFSAAMKSVGWAVFQIRDNGDGPTQQIADKLFEPFVTSRPEGLGLGLAQVRLACEHLKGQIRWRRELDKTVFELELPVEPTMFTSSHE